MLLDIYSARKLPLESQDRLQLYARAVLECKIDRRVEGVCADASRTKQNSAVTTSRAVDLEAGRESDVAILVLAATASPDFIE